jgi:hypothetical protein
LADHLISSLSSLPVLSDASVRSMVLPFVGEFLAHATKWLQYQQRIASRYQSPLLTLRTLKALTVVWNNSVTNALLLQLLVPPPNGDNDRQHSNSEQSSNDQPLALLDVLAISLANTYSHTQSSTLLVYTIAALLALITENHATHAWFTRGNGIRGILQAIRSNIHQTQQLVQDRPADLEASSDPTLREQAWTASNLARVLCNLTQSEAILDCLRHLAPLIQHHHLSVASLMLELLQTYNDTTLRAIALGYTSLGQWVTCVTGLIKCWVLIQCLLQRRGQHLIDLDR